MGFTETLSGGCGSLDARSCGGAKMFCALLVGSGR